MTRKRIENIANEVWNSGTYLSTRVRDQRIINTYAYKGFFIHIEFCAALGQIVDVKIDDDLELGFSHSMELTRFKINLN